MGILVIPLNLQLKKSQFSFESMFESLIKVTSNLYCFLQPREL